MIVNKPLLEAVVAGANALRNNAADIQKDPQFKADNGAGRLLNLGHEQVLQYADLLEGWAKRNGWSEEL